MTDQADIELRAEKAALVTYLLTKVRREDWHAVMDAAADLRELETKMDCLRTYREEHPS